MAIVSGGGSGGGIAGVTNTGGAITIAPTNDNPTLAELTVAAAAGSKAGASELFGIYDDLGAQKFGVDAVGGFGFGMVTAPFTGRVGFAVDGASDFFVIGPTPSSTAYVASTGRAKFLGVQGNPLTAGALPTVAPVSATPFQCLTTRDVTLVVPFTGDATNNAATLKIELSPDNVTYSTLDTLSIAAALNLTGAINVPITLAVPAGWYVNLTATHGTIGTSTYY